ncbi:MAG: glycosyltransferase [Clostridia bacterium]|nr:glycosyltransferase [Clostridia bacterium]
MGKRIIFCAQVKFPRGDAGANRVLYMAKAMREHGFDVIVISPGTFDSDDVVGEMQEYCGIKYTYYRKFSGKIGKIYNRLWSSVRDTVKILKKLNMTTDDCVVIYSSGYFYLKYLIKFLNKKKIDTYIDVVEHHQRDQYESFFTWINYKNAFDICHKTGRVIAISEHLKKYFEDKGCIAPVLPVFTDKNDYEAVVKTKMEKTVFIYPGNAYVKDDMKAMISAFAALSDEEKHKVEFHITATNERIMKKILGEDYDDLKNKVKDCVFVHSWLEYDELINLYKKAQFLLLVRPDNIVTRANFPSKVPELMITGIIPMITEVGDVVKYLTDGKDSFVLKNPTSVEICKDALKKAMNLSDGEIRKMSINARKTAEEKFDCRNWAEKMGEIFG